MSKHDQEVETDDVGSVPTFFREHQQFFEYLEQIASMAGDRETWVNSEASEKEEETQLVRKASGILEAYQEQPMCLDPHLERIVNTLMSVIQEYVHALYESTVASSTSTGISMSRMSELFDLVYTLCKVRGYKVILRFFPHSVADVEPVFAMLWCHSSVDAVAPSWTTRYILLIWLSLLAMVPFDMASIDSGLSNPPALDLSTVNRSGRINTCAHSLMAKWIELGKLHLNKSGCEMEGAAVMLAHLLSRRDALEKEQPEFISWTTREISESTGLAAGDNASKSLGINSILRINGALRVLCHLFLVMDSPTALDEQLEPLLAIFQSDAFEQHSITRKLISKASQRLALLFLPPVPPKPTVDYNGISLRENLESSTSSSRAAKETPDLNHLDDDTADGCVDQAEDIELSAEVEAFVGILLQKLHDKDTIVRWSAAKGVARIAERLPPVLAQEIVGAVASILQEETLEDESGRADISMTSEFSWHGALMSLAELSRRGLLPPQMLRETIPWIVRGLTYEIQRGNYSVGSNVRDAACYVMWSFARITNPLSKAVFAELSTDMATALISVATFDREPNVRRAASAAYQEHVGRHTRELAAKALGGLAPLAPEYVISDLLPAIVAATASPFLAVRHGAVLSLGVVAEVLGPRLQNNVQLSEMVLSVPGNIPERYIQDFGASLTLSAVASYIGCLSRAGWGIDGSQGGGSGMRQKQFFDYFVQALTVCKEAQGIVPEFTAFVDKCGLSDEQHSIVERYTRVERSGTSCQSFVLAMGALNGQGDFELLCRLVTQGATVETRRNAAAALAHVCQRWTQGSCGAGSDRATKTPQNELAVTEALLEGLLDHSVDNRGDVGSWVRKQCLETLLVLCGSDSTLITRMAAGHHGSDIVVLLLGRTLRATTEKLDKLRTRAGELLETLLYTQQDDGDTATVVTDLPPPVQRCLAQLRMCILPRGGINSDFRRQDGGDGLSTDDQQDKSERREKSEDENEESGINWADPEAAFAHVVHALSVDEQRLRQPLFEGLVITGSAEPLGKFAVKAVSSYADTLPPTSEASLAAKSSSSNQEAAATASEQSVSHSGQWSVDGIVDELTRLLLTDRRTSKVINPALIVADQLIEQGALAAASPEK
ncbi:hypothetical protein EV178_000918 [Coemansia sp. RSA 1646]|nr:hypothetical protein EV178_000918 [Coemansia sp. RSA 1646]